MKNTRKLGKSPSAEKIARLAERGDDVSRFFTNTGRMMEPIQMEPIQEAHSVRKKARRA